MADQNGTVIHLLQLLHERGFPALALRIAFTRHSRISDFVIRPEISGETFHHPVVPLIVHAFVPSLNEQHVTWCRGGHFVFQPITSEKSANTECRANSHIGGAS